MANWTRDQLLAALNLYHRTPFGKQHSTHPPIVELAELIDRTPAAVAMKLSNFTSLDPIEQARGIKGLSGASNADREIWAEFETNLNALAEQSEEALESFPASDSKSNSDDEPPLPRGLTETTALVKVRRQQSFFRKAILGAYGNRCCITGNPVPTLLRASHIVPWAEREEERCNPRNGLCLSATYDAAFDRGLISLDEDFRVIISASLKLHLPNPELERTFLQAEGKPITLPDRSLPDKSLLAWHRKTLFTKAQQ